MADAAEEPWKDREWLYDQYHGKERSYQQIADDIGTTHSTIRHWMEKHEIPRRSLSEANAEGDIHKLRDASWLRKRYVDEGLSGRQIALQLDTCSDTVHKWLRKHGIEVKHRSEIMSDGDVQKLHDKCWLEREYVDKERPATDIADECDVDSMTVYTWLEKHSIPTRCHGISRSDGDIRKLREKQWLRERYIDRQLSTREIAKETSTSKNAVLRWLRKHSIDIRPKTPVGDDHHWSKEQHTSEYGPNWDEQRLKARIRDHARCQVCGKTDKEHMNEYGRVNHVHHILPRSEFMDENGMLDYEAANRLSNLITLCSKHHGKLEGIPIDARHL